jgi:photosystem II stability/assembly factor-like uncharacterized protein
MAAHNPELQWRPTAAPVASSRTDDIWFVDPQTGWAVNSNGQIIHTNDGGASWIEQKHEAVYWRCLGFATPQRGWAGTLTRGKRLFATTDGGNTWDLVEDRLPADAPTWFCGLSVVNEQVVYASGTNDPFLPAAMAKSVDGGATWVGWSMAAHASLLVDTYFTTPERGLVVGGKATVPNPTRDDVKPVVLFTTDGGVTWENRVANLTDDFPFGEWGWKIQFLDDEVGFVALENFTDGAILTTTDGGLTWQRQPVDDPQGNANLEGIGFIDAQQGWVGGWGTADFAGGFSSETRDGGATWHNANQIGRFLNRFRFFGEPVTVGYASGDTVYKYSTEPVPAAFDEAIAAGPRLLDDVAPAQVDRPMTIGFTVPTGAKRLTIEVWDRFGAPMGRLIDESEPASGHRALTWGFLTDSGTLLPDGYYIYRLTIDGESESRIVQLQTNT